MLNWPRPLMIFEAGFSTIPRQLAARLFSSDLLDPYFKIQAKQIDLLNN